MSEIARNNLSRKIIPVDNRIPASLVVVALGLDHPGPVIIETSCGQPTTLRQIGRIFQHSYFGARYQADGGYGLLIRHSRQGLRMLIGPGIQETVISYRILLIGSIAVVIVKGHRQFYAAATRSLGIIHYRQGIGKAVHPGAA